MTFDESNSQITDSLCGRTIERVERHGKELVFVTTCGHEVKLQSDTNHDIHFKGCGVKIMLDSIPMGAIQGQF
jgi:hypothetical protein